MCHRVYSCGLSGREAGLLSNQRVNQPTCTCGLRMIICVKLEAGKAMRIISLLVWWPQVLNQEGNKSTKRLLKKKSSYSFGIKMLLYRYRQRLKHSRGCVCLIWYLSVFINAVVTVSRFWRLQRTLSLHITAAFFLFVLFHGDVKLKLYVVKWRLSCDKDVTHSISGSFHQKAALLLRARGWNKLRNKINF